MDREAWRATVHGVAESRTQLSMQSMYVGRKGSLGFFCNILHICVCLCVACFTQDNYFQILSMSYVSIVVV